MPSPKTIKEAEDSGLPRMSDEEFEKFISLIPQAGPMRQRLVDCTIPENEGALCWKINCYMGKEVFVFCQNGRCAARFYQNC